MAFMRGEYNDIRCPPEAPIGTAHISTPQAWFAVLVIFNSMDSIGKLRLTSLIQKGSSKLIKLTTTSNLNHFHGLEHI